MLLVIIGVVLRRRALVSARRLVAEDNKTYDAMWARLTAAPGATDALAKVCSEVKRLASAGRPEPGRLGYVHQLARRAQSSATAAAAPWWALPCSEHLPHVALPVRCLDQLVATAGVAAPLLVERVQRWALASGGGFPLRRQMRGCVWIRWADAQDDPVVSRLVKWAQCKSAARAVEKTVRSYDQVYCTRIHVQKSALLCRLIIYVAQTLLKFAFFWIQCGLEMIVGVIFPVGQDASRLLDLCRQCILFATIADVAACLAAMGDDPAIRIVQVVLTTLIWQRKFEKEGRVDSKYEMVRVAKVHIYPGHLICVESLQDIT